MVDGIAVHALASAGPDAGRGRIPVVLVHGLGMSSRYMAPLAECLSRDVAVFAPDMPGFGRSSDPQQALTVPGMAAALAGWMDAMGIGRAMLVGNSLGCEVLVELALRRPDLVDGLVLQGPTPDPEHASPVRQAALFLLTSVFERPSIARVAVVDYLRAGLWRYAQTFRYMTRYRMAKGLPDITVPALVVVGARDYLVPRDWAERMARLLPRARLIIVPRAAHGMNYSHPQALRQAILPFLLARTEATRPYRFRSGPGVAASGR